MTIKEVFKALLDRIYLVVIIPFVFITIASVAVYYFITPTYTASTTMYVLNKQNESSSSVAYTDLTSSSLLTADYRELATSKRVLDAAAEELGITSTEISSYDISVAAVNNTRVIKISVAGRDAVMAANIANVVQREFAKCVVEIMAVNNVNVIDYAVPPTTPSAPKKLQTIALAGIGGIVVAVIVALMAEMLNTTIRTGEDVENAFGVPVLAKIPKLEENK